MTTDTLSLFYKLKPYLPRSLQIAARRIRAQRIFGKMNPPYLHSSYLEANTHPDQWPHKSDCPVLLTHDVETAEGLRKIELIRKVERKHGVVSNWNFVLDKYGDVTDYVKKLTDEGCECGAHGLYHDGLLFRDKNTYDERMKKIVELAAKLNLRGFRSPALHHNVDWMQNLPFKWDSSFPAWDPFQPQPGGCKNYVPYKLNAATWELPVTFFQDFTLFTELQQNNIDIWLAQTDALAKRGLLVNIIVHPDYMDDLLLSMYDGFIDYLSKHYRSWITTPSMYCDLLDRVLAVEIPTDGKM